ncbi:hypothetical protein CC2G_012328 [Coprinopsis cinerea AmutBmut pab1-1]|nr:hypothetical protein CC2G_012328 [Coprinopsis cinerea AmutBmut pab1-1]
MRFLRRELIHTVWLLLMDDDFMEAYHHGIPAEFWDGVIRQVFPRIFADSADYPEKMLLACLKYLASCPCPRCLIPKSKIGDLGTARDRLYRQKFKRTDDHPTRHTIQSAREKVFLNGLSPGNRKLNSEHLGPKSLTPRRSAFSERLADSGFNVYEMFAPDILHEFEIGVAKEVLVHLIRMLHVVGSAAVKTFNERWRMIPSFGNEIRRIRSDVSEMKRLAARDIEDLIQCAIPVFEGLFPRGYEPMVRKLLFELATWHSLAKLRLHSDRLLSELDASTYRLGKLLREFEKVSSGFKTRELPFEIAKRIRARANQKKKGAGKGKGKARDPGPDGTSDEPQQKMFSINTPKIHALGHYTEFIRHAGTTDSYSSSLHELEHRRVKRHYVRSPKGTQVFTAGIAKQQRRERIVHHLTQQFRGAKNRPMVPRGFLERLPKSSPNAHHHMSNEVSPRTRINLIQWVTENNNDPAFKDFIPKLRSHLLSRLMGLEYSGDEDDYTPEQLARVVIIGDAIYRHKTLRVNFTTYDRRRDQNTLNPSTSSDIMMLSHDDSPHPYWYARTVGVFHVRVKDVARPTLPPQEMDFLWIRWFGVNSERQFGWKVKRLLRIGFVDEKKDLSPAFGFLNPAQVIRGIHLIPDFTAGQSANGLGPSLVRREGDKDVDWNYFYVSWFCPRDIFMRFRGGGVGHAATREATSHFLSDRDEIDLKFINQEPVEALGTVVDDPAALQSDEDRALYGGAEDDDPVAAAILEEEILQNEDHEELGDDEERRGEEIAEHSEPEDDEDDWEDDDGTEDEREEFGFAPL